jgi:hypothetical protein
MSESPVPGSRGRAALVLAIASVVVAVAELLLANLLFRFVQFPGFVYGALYYSASVVLLILNGVTLLAGTLAVRRGALLYGGIAVGVGGAGTLGGLAAVVVLPILNLIPAG